MRVFTLPGHSTSMDDTLFMANEVVRKRRPKFTSNELQALADGVGRHQHIIHSKFSDCITNNKKKYAWHAVTDSINAVSEVLRDPDEVRRKWRDWASVIKHKEQKRRNIHKTGDGGIIIAMTPVEEKVVELLGEAVILGIDTSTSKQGFTSSAPTGPACGTLAARNVSRSRSRSPPLIHDSRSTSPLRKLYEHKPLASALLKTTFLTEDPTVQLVTIEREKLKTDQQRLAMEKERLEVEKSRLSVEKRKLAAMEKFFSTKQGGDGSDSETSSSFLL